MLVLLSVKNKKNICQFCLLSFTVTRSNVTHLSLASHKGDPDQMLQNVVFDSGSTLFALHTGISIKHGYNKN